MTHREKVSELRRLVHELYPIGSRWQWSSSKPQLFEVFEHTDYGLKMISKDHSPSLIHTGVFEPPTTHDKRPEVCHCNWFHLLGGDLIPEHEQR